MKPLIFGNTHWEERKRCFSFPRLEKDLTTEVLIVGGGMSGTLCTHVLTDAGYQDITVVEGRHVATGSSRANTGLLQVSSDTMLTEFIETLGEAPVKAFYTMCKEAMEALHALKNRFPTCSLRGRKSLYLATKKDHVKDLMAESLALQSIGINAGFYTGEEVKEWYDLLAYGALYVEEDLDVDPVRFIYTITEANLQRGVQYFEETEVDLSSLTAHGVRIKNGATLTFDHVILATGYGHLYPFMKDLVEIHRTYAFFTEPLEEEPWRDGVMIWETQKPYGYLRVSQDQRIIAGGLDEEVDEVLNDQEKLDEILEKLKGEARRLVGHALPLEVCHGYNALFGTVKDGLPLMGAHRDHPNHYYLLGYEGNGTCYSMAGARLILELLQGGPSSYTPLVSLHRGSKG